MSIDLMWILFVLTCLVGGLALLMMIYILRVHRVKRNHITTYSNRKTKTENGPVLELPDGILPASPERKTEA